MTSAWECSPSVGFCAVECPLPTFYATTHDTDARETKREHKADSLICHGLVDLPHLLSSDELNVVALQASSFFLRGVMGRVARQHW